MFPFRAYLAILLFLEIFIFRIIRNTTSCLPIRSVIILLINKSDTHCAVIRFCCRSCDLRPNWIPLIPLRKTFNCLSFLSRVPYNKPKQFVICRTPADISNKKALCLVSFMITNIIILTLSCVTKKAECVI